jgi:amino acid transporter
MILFKKEKKKEKEKKRGRMLSIMKVRTIICKWLLWEYKFEWKSLLYQADIVGIINFAIYNLYIFLWLILQKLDCIKFAQDKEPVLLLN